MEELRHKLQTTNKLYQVYIDTELELEDLISELVYDILSSFSKNYSINLDKLSKIIRVSYDGRYYAAIEIFEHLGSIKLKLASLRKDDFIDLDSCFKRNFSEFSYSEQLHVLDQIFDLKDEILNQRK